MTTTEDGPARFEVDDGPVDIETLAVGFTESGLAGLTAVDYLSDQLPMDQRGHLETTGPPTITPFENGVPRHHTRLYVDEGRSLGVIVAERAVPVGGVEPIAGAIGSLCGRLDPDNLTVLSGVPVAHGPEDHAPFYIATPEYRERYLDGTDIRPMGTGFVDGVSARLLADGIGDDERPVGVFTTPAHPQAPDAAAAIRLVEALNEAHGTAVDIGPLEAFASTVESQYKALSERMDAAKNRAQPEDRMYM